MLWQHSLCTTVYGGQYLAHTTEYYLSFCRGQHQKRRTIVMRRLCSDQQRSRAPDFNSIEDLKNFDVYKNNNKCNCMPRGRGLCAVTTHGQKTHDLKLLFAGNKLPTKPDTAFFSSKFKIHSKNLVKHGGHNTNHTARKQNLFFFNSQELIVEIDARGKTRRREDPTQIQRKNSDGRKKLFVNWWKRYLGNLRKLCTLSIPKLMYRKKARQAEASK